MIEFKLEVNLKEASKDILDLFITKPKISLHLQGSNYNFIAWGDPIAKSSFRNEFELNCTPEFISNNLYGHYYYVLIHKSTLEIIIGSSLFSILPIYYTQTNDKIILSENVFSIGKNITRAKIDKRFILESILFNYPLSNRTIFHEVRLLPTNSVLSIYKGKLSIRKTLKIWDYFADDPIPWRKTILPVCECFLDSVQKYMPDEHFLISLTGGFDGRTLASTGVFFKKHFSTYCFGSEYSNDIKIAELISKVANLNFINVHLDKNYALRFGFDLGKEFIQNSSGTATFARAHYLYSAKFLANFAEKILTGNFGSEIFRAAHNSGEMISNNLFLLFKSNTPNKAFKDIETQKEFLFLNNRNFKSDWESLKEEILLLPCFNPDYKDLSRNKRFYVFVFEEIFRKYFGAEMVNQYKYIINRTPFLDIDFLKYLLNTSLPGVHSDYLEKNPIKRFKGQVFYSQIIRQTHPTFGGFTTDKGYKPDDLIDLFGKLNVVSNYLKKHINVENSGYDPYFVHASWELNNTLWKKEIISSDYFNNDAINGLQVNNYSDILFKIFSLTHLMNQIMSTN